MSRVRTIWIVILSIAGFGVFLACNGDSPTGNDGPVPGPGSGNSINISSPEIRLAPGGLEWTKRQSGTLSGLISVASGNGKIVIAGNNGVILTSSDGMAWTLLNVGRNVALNHVIWTGKQFITVGDSGTIATSADGEHWTLRHKSPDYHLESVAWNGSTFIAAGGLFIHSGLSQPAMLTSLDGEQWTAGSPGHGIFFGAAWGDVAFLAVGYNYDFTTVADYSSAVMYLSRDGHNWSVINANITDHNAFTHVIFDNRRFVAVGGSRNVNDAFASVYTTSDFENWNRVSVPTRNTLEGVAFTGSEYVAVGQRGTIIMSDTSGWNWKTRTSGVLADLNAVAATSVGWQLVAVGDSGTILTSPCGRSAVTPPTPHPLVGYWKQGEDVYLHGNGDRTPGALDSTYELLYGFKADHSATIFAFLGGDLMASSAGSWSVSGSRLSMSFTESVDNIDYRISGNQCTLTFPDTLNGESVTHQLVLKRI